MKKILAVLLSLVTVFASVTFAFADPATTVVGGDFQLQYTAQDGKVTDTSSMLWWEFQATSYKNFSDNSQAYLQLKATKDDSLFMGGFGYTYKVNDKLSFTARNDANGEWLTDGQVIGNGCDWRQLSKGVNFFDRVFIERTEVKVDAVPFQGFNLTVAYAPEGTSRLSKFADPFPEQYLVKGKYTTDTFDVGFGYTSTRDGYAEGNSSDDLKTQNPKRPLYSLYGNIFPDANNKFYWEYIDGGAYLAKATLTYDPITLKATYGNDMWYQKVGHPDYLPNSLDCELDYALSDTKTIIGGMAYFLGTDHDNLANAKVGITIGPLTAELYHDFGAVNIPVMTGVDGTASTSIIAKYNLDGTNTLEANYNIDKQIVNAKLYIYFW